jgi:hypothetical protein
MYKRQNQKSLFLKRNVDVFGDVAQLYKKAP